MDLKVFSSVKKSRPLAKELKLQEFRYRYLLLMTLYLCVAVLPSLAWMSLGRSYNILSVELFALACLLSASIYTYPKYQALYEGRLTHIYPLLKKLSKKQRAMFRLSFGLSLLVPTLHIATLLFLFNQKKVRKENPFFLSHPLKTNLAIWFFIVLLPILSFAVSGNSKLDLSLPKHYSYWIGTPSTSIISGLFHDTEESFIWINKNKQRIINERHGHNENNNLFAQKLKSKKIKSSPISPYFISYGYVGAVLLVEKNNRSISSKTSDSNMTIYILENIIEAYKNWEPALLYAINPLSFLNPGTIPEFALISPLTRFSNLYVKKKF